MKKNEDDTNKWKDISYYEIQGLNIVKMSILPKCNLQFKCDPYESAENIFHRIQACNSKICIKVEKNKRKTVNKKSK